MATERALPDGCHHCGKSQVYCHANQHTQNQSCCQSCTQTQGAHCVDAGPVDVCSDCGYPEGSFACKVRHVQVNTGWAKAAND